MDWLALALEDRFSGMLGEAALNVGDLTEQRPLAGAISFVQVKNIKNVKKGLGFEDHCPPSIQNIPLK